MQAFRACLGENDTMAYLAMMAPRIIELRRVLNGHQSGEHGPDAADLAPRFWAA